MDLNEDEDVHPSGWITLTPAQQLAVYDMVEHGDLIVGTDSPLRRHNRGRLGYRPSAMGAIYRPLICAAHRPRPRGAGRPARRPARRGGDSGDSGGDDGPPSPVAGDEGVAS